MKKNILFSVFIFFSLFSWAQNPASFITTWEIPANDLSLELVPIHHTNNLFDIDFGDGTTLSNQTNYVNHTYSEPGTYTVSITGFIANIHLNFFADCSKLQTVEQWGTIPWVSTSKMFENCPNIQINATDTPNLSNVTNMSEMFKGATNFNSPIGNWDVSNVQNMIGMFQAAESFNQPLNSWNVSNVNEMKLMFYGASAFNQDLNSWDVSNVEVFHNMFLGASAFNGNITNWNVSNAVNMSGFFQNASSFNQPIGNWDVSSTTSMSGMFFGATSFNQPIDNWDVSSLVNIANLFSYATSFNQPLNSWNTTNLINTSYAFRGATAFNQPLNNWNVSNVTNTSGMFKGAVMFNHPLNNWNVFKVTNMSEMFFEAEMFNQDLSDWTFSEIVGLNGFLSYSDMNIEHYDALLNSFYQQNLTSIDVGVHSLQYCDAQTRNNLINERNFYFIGDTLASNCGMNRDSNSINLLSIYPNPTNGELYFNNSEGILITNIAVYNALGQMVYSLENTYNSLDLKHLKEGIYILSFKVDTATQHLKFVKI